MEKQGEAMMTREQLIEKARGLPKELQNFFARYPAKAIAREVTLARADIWKRLSVHDSEFTASTRADLHRVEERIDAYTREEVARPPFAAWKNPLTHRWYGPVYTPRQRINLVKAAETHGLSELLETYPKEWKLVRPAKFREEKLLSMPGLRPNLRGSRLGSRVKGHAWERRIPQRQETIRQAMKGMGDLIQSWRRVSILIVHSTVVKRTQVRIELTVLNSSRDMAATGKRGLNKEADRNMGELACVRVNELRGELHITGE